MKDCVAIKLCLCFITLSSFHLKAYYSFFIKHSSGRCVSSAPKPHLSTPSVKIWYLELSNDCTKPQAQFRFINDGVLHHASSTGCVLPSDGKALPKVETKLVVFAAKDVCTNKSSQAYIQTQYGSLRHASLKCIQPHMSFVSVPPVGAHIEYTAVCNKTLQNFILGSVTCEGQKAKDINCPASQVIRITKANYGGFGSIKTCGYNRNYNCLLPSALCYVRRRCDGHRSCEIDVTTSEFKEDSCPGMMKYLYVEYKCIDKTEFKEENMIIKRVRLSSESKPGEGYIELKEESEQNVWQRLCTEDMKDNEKEVICRTLGYSGIKQEQSSVGSGQDVEGNLQMSTLHANVYCNSNENNVSSCCLEKLDSEEKTCSTMVRISCAICNEPVLSELQNETVIFSASASLPGHHAGHAAVTSSSTWCARDASDYLKIDLGEAYVITQLAMLGDVSRGNWVRSYEVLYSENGTTWLPGIAHGQNRLAGNSASDELSSVIFDAVIHGRFIKIFPKSWQGLPCLKLEICGHKLLPGAPRNVSLSSVTAYTAELSWIKPADTGDGSLTRYQISLFRAEKLVSNKSSMFAAWHFDSLRPYTQYKVVVRAGNRHGYGGKTELTFRTNSTTPSAPPMNIKLSPISSTSLDISWKSPPSFHRNGIISGYEVCFASVNSDEICDRIIRTRGDGIRLGYLLPATEYRVKVLARNDAGSGNYSDEYFHITNAEAPVCNRSSITDKMFVVKLQKPRDEVRFCQVIVVALPSRDSFPKQDLYSANAVTYLEASGSPVPYIAAEFLASDFMKYQEFTVGDRTIFPALVTLHNSKSQAKKYLNGPLTPKTRYALFQRFFSNEKLLYSSDFLVPVKTHEVKIVGNKTDESSFQAILPRLPPTDIELKVKSSTIIYVSWKAPFLQNSLGITGYEMCVAYVQSDEECDLIVRTKDTTSVVSSLKAATKYRVKVKAKNKIGYGQYSKDYFVMTRGASPSVIPSEITKESFTIKLEPARTEIRFCQIVLITLPTNGSLPKSSQYLEDYNSYYDAKASAKPSSYIAAEFNVIDFEKYREFTVGDAGITLGVVGMSKYGTAVREYFNGPLSPDTMYTTFLRFYSEQDLVYSSDFLPPIKTKQKDNVNEFKEYQAESKSSQEKFKLPFIIVLVMLLIIVLMLGVVVVYRRHQMQQNNVQFSGDRTGSVTIAEIDPNNDRGNCPTRV